MSSSLLLRMKSKRASLLIESVDSHRRTDISVSLPLSSYAVEVFMVIPFNRSQNSWHLSEHMLVSTSLVVSPLHSALVRAPFEYMSVVDFQCILAIAKCIESYMKTRFFLINPGQVNFSLLSSTLALSIFYNSNITQTK